MQTRSRYVSFHSPPGVSEEKLKQDVIKRTAFISRETLYNMYKLESTAYITVLLSQISRRQGPQKWNNRLDFNIHNRIKQHSPSDCSHLRSNRSVSVSILQSPRPCSLLCWEVTQGKQYTTWPWLVSEMEVCTEVWYAVTQTSTKSRAQSFSGSLSAVGRWEKLWDDAISLNVVWIFLIGCLQNSLSRTATNQKIEKILKEILLSRSLSRRPAAGKEPEKL